MGFFLGSSSSTEGIDKEEERVSALMNSDLIKETESLVSLLEQICRQPESLHLNGNKLVDEIGGLVDEDHLSAINEFSIRVNEFGERLSCLSFGDSVELVCALKRLEDCKERLLRSSTVKKDVVGSFWDSIREIKERVGKQKENKLVKKTESLSDSARFGERVLRSGDSVRFSSARMTVNYRFPLPIELDSMKSYA